MNAPAFPKRTYVASFAALLALTALTVFVARHDLGRWNAAVALTIAVAKALLVALYFMHLRKSSGLVVLVAGAAFYWLAILIALTLGDTLTRDWLPILRP